MLAAATSIELPPNDTLRWSPPTREYCKKFDVGSSGTRNAAISRQKRASGRVILDGVIKYVVFFVTASNYVFFSLRGVSLPYVVSADAAGHT